MFLDREEGLPKLCGLDSLEPRQVDYQTDYIGVKLVFDLAVY